MQAAELHGGGRERHLRGVPRQRHELHGAVEKRLLEIRVGGQLLCAPAVAAPFENTMQNPAPTSLRGT